MRIILRDEVGPVVSAVFDVELVGGGGGGCTTAVPTRRGGRGGGGGVFTLV
jgi:hypothetical protein